MKKKKQIENRFLNRRQFLVGSGSILLLPPLISLMPKEVAAQVIGNPKRRAVFWISQNGIDSHQLYPVNQTDLIPLANATSVNYKLLNNFNGNISRMIDGDFVSMYPHMNLMQGLSLCGGSWAGHNHGVLAGVHSGERDPKFGRSVDVVLEKSPGVYKPGESVPVKAIRHHTCDSDLNYSYDRTSGKIVISDTLQGDRNFFNKLFSGFSDPTAPTSTDPKLIVDKVYADLQTLKSNKRLSSADKIVLDRYIASVFDLQLKVGVGAGPVCQKPTIAFQAKTSGSYYHFPDQWGITNTGTCYENIMEIIKVAFACDLTRVVYLGNNLWRDAPIGDGGGYGTHHDCGGSNVSADHHQWGLKKMLHLAKLLSATADPSGGGTLLDNSILLYTNELGDWTTGHNIFSMPAVTFGSCGGYFKTGYFVDYRQKPLKLFQGYHVGRPYKQLLQSIMLAMGVPRTEYLQYGDGNGYGEFNPNINQFGNVLNGAYSMYANEHNDPLPWVTG